MASDNCAAITDNIDKNDAAYEFIERISTQGYIIGKQKKLQLRQRRRASHGSSLNENVSNSTAAEVIDID